MRKVDMNFINWENSERKIKGGWHGGKHNASCLTNSSVYFKIGVCMTMDDNKCEKTWCILGEPQNTLYECSDGVSGETMDWTDAT